MAATPSVVGGVFKLNGSGLDGVFLDITLDSSYPNGGYTLPGIKLNRIHRILFGGTRAGYSFDWDAPNQKLKVLDVPTTPNHSALVECSPGANLSTVTVTAFAIGQ